MALSCLQANKEIKITQFVSKLFTTRNLRAIFEAISYIALLAKLACVAGAPKVEGEREDERAKRVRIGSTAPPRGWLAPPALSLTLSLPLNGLSRRLKRNYIVTQMLTA